MTDPDKGLSDTAKAYRSAMPWLTAISTLTSGAALGVLVGWGVDKWGQWQVPWGILVGSVVGISVGFYGFFKAVLSMGKKSGAGK